MSGQPPQPHLIQAFDEQSDVTVDLDRYVALAEFVLGAERFGIDAELTLVFVDEPTMGDYHERFLDEPGPTDVMAFPLDEDLPAGGRSPDGSDRGPGSAIDAASEPPAMLGDVMVCPAFAARGALAAGRDVGAEIDLLVVHGVLHLLGHDHDTDESETAMFARQAELLAAFSERATEATS